MGALDRKVLRDFGRLWAQALAIALVMACGVASLVTFIGAARNLDETRAAYYERYRFGDIFASLKRAPANVAGKITAIDGVAAVEARVRDLVILDITGMREPASGMAISLPDFREPSVNRPFLRDGRLPHPGNPDEVAVTEAFAKAHGFSPGARFQAVLNGTKRTLTISGVVLSPEFIYALGPGDIMPDDKRFGILFFSQRALAGLLDLEGAFNDVSVRLLKGANEQAVLDALDRILEVYGGAGAIPRKDQQSHAFLDSELEQLRSIAGIIPPIFLAVSAFLINMILSRLIALEREQIGLFKAVGYSSTAVAAHYIKLVVAISALGIAGGFALGTWLGNGMFRLYGDFFHFPFLIFRTHADVYLIAAAVSLLAGVAGGLNAVWKTVRLAPAVAMRPPSPTVYRKLAPERLGLLKPFSRLTVMGLRHLMRHPVRSGLTALGTSFAVGLLVISMFFADITNALTAWLYDQHQRQSATLIFSEEQGPGALQAVRRLPGVLDAEPMRSVSALLRHAHHERRMSLTAATPDAQLVRVVDDAGRPVFISKTGLTLTERAAAILEARRGDLIDVQLLQGKRRSARLPVAEIVPSYFGYAVFMHADALDRLAGEGPRIGGANLMVDAHQVDALYAAIKQTPQIGSLTLQDASRAKFDETLEQNIVIATTVYVMLAVIVAFGVVYNAARIQLSERARELASLRVLGFTEREVYSVLLAELGAIVMIAQPLGWLIGLGLCWLVVNGFDSDLFRMPFVIEADTFAIASLVTLAAVAVSCIIIWQRILNLDLIRVLKTRE